MGVRAFGVESLSAIERTIAPILQLSNCAGVRKVLSRETQTKTRFAIIEFKEILAKGETPSGSQLECAPTC
jgi:hypothetical protein